MGSKPLISEQENGLAIKLERGRIHCLSSLYIPWLLHFCPHLYLSVRSQGSNTGYWHWHSVLLPADSTPVSLILELSAQIFLITISAWPGKGVSVRYKAVGRYHDLWCLCRVTPSSDIRSTDRVVTGSGPWSLSAASELRSWRKHSGSEGKCEPHPVSRPHLIFIAELVITQRVSTSNTAADISIEITNHSGVWSETSLGFPPSCSYRLFWVSEQSLTIWWS